MSGQRIGILSIFVAIFFIHVNCSTFTSASKGPATTVTQIPLVSGDDHRQSMFLPLFISYPSPSYFSSSARRYLRISDPHSPRHNARMGLYDDLLMNGYYTTHLFIGTPPQSFALIVDTGSTVTYVPCSTCEHCGKHQDPKFDPVLSSSYQPVKCNADCNCDNEREQCVYERHYAELSTSSGVLVEDLISFGNQSELGPQRVVFGCENTETGDLFSQHADGIMGLGSGDLSIMDQLVDRGVIEDSFSLCYGGMNVGGGAMVLGAISPPAEMVFTHSDSGRSQYYNIALNGIKVAGKRLALDRRVFDGKHGSVLDSGTTYAYIPEAAFIAFKSAILEELHSLKQITGPDPNYNDICFSGAGSDVSKLSESFPSVDLVFSNGQKLSLSPENYLFQHSKARGSYCLGIFQNGKDPTTLLGGIVVRNTLVMYDRGNERVGFLKTNCSELWKTLQIPDYSPEPSIPMTKNSTHGIPPPVAPHQTLYNFSGVVKVGLIIFNVSLNIKYSYLKPRLSELVGFVARDLDVNSSQVRFLNSVANGNDSLLTCAIYPAGPSDFFPNSTARKIVARLAEHRMQLPAGFGSYELLEWKVRPPSKRTWWGRGRKMGVTVGAIVALVVAGSLGSGLWLIWRRHGRSRQVAAAVAYKPVDSAVPEQELASLS